MTRPAWCRSIFFPNLTGVILMVLWWLGVPLLQWFVFAREIHSLRGSDLAIANQMTTIDNQHTEIFRQLLAEEAGTRVIIQDALTLMARNQSALVGLVDSFSKQGEIVTGNQERIMQLVATQTVVLQALAQEGKRPKP